MQEYLRAELEGIAGCPALDDWLERVRLRRDAARIRIASEEILRQRDLDRR